MIRILIFLMCMFSYSQTVESIKLPKDYERKTWNPYHSWIIKQKISYEPVRYYTGQPISLYTYAKFDYDIGNEDLHQCADATIYLHAKYNYDTNNLDKIKYHFTNGMVYSYNEYLKGYRPVINYSNWESKVVKQAIEIDNTYNNLKEYLFIIWRWAGTLSLETHDTTKVYTDPQPGDMFIRGGSPGHVMNVIDKISSPWGENLYMLAESWMPAQEHYILINLDDTPWFTLNEIKQQIGFTKLDLKKFKQ